MNVVIDSYLQAFGKRAKLLSHGISFAAHGHGYNPFTLPRPRQVNSRSDCLCTFDSFGVVGCVTSSIAQSRSLATQATGLTLTRMAAPFPQPLYGFREICRNNL
jgi:hypothetical protein